MRALHKVSGLLALTLALAMPLHAEVAEVRIAKGAGGMGFLPLMVMEKYKLVEKNAKAAGIPELKASYVSLGGPAVVNDALLSGAIDLAPAGITPFLVIWGRTQSSLKVKGVAAISALPMYLNTTAPHIRSLEDVTEKDKIAVTAVKVSLPSLIMQMLALKKYGPGDFAHYDRYTVSLTHPDGVIAMLSGRSEINLHFTSPPFHQREIKDPRVRTILNTNDVLGGPSTFTMFYATTKFHDSNPKTYAVVIKALEEAQAMIESDRQAAARLYLDSDEGKGWTADEIVGVLKDPNISFTSAPSGVMQFLTFMNAVGTVKAKADNWKELFFPEIHHVNGN